MDRRAFLRTTGGAAVAASAGTAAAAHTAPELSQDTSVAAPGLVSGITELRLAGPWSAGFAGHADQAQRLVRRIEAMSGGRYRVSLAAGLADGLAAVRADEADLYFGTEHDHLAHHRALAYFAGLPGNRGVPPHDFVAWVLVGGGQELWDDLAAGFGVKALLAGHTGAQSVFVATRNVASMSELAGAKAAVAGLARDVVHGIGLKPVAIADAGLARAMARGEILVAERGGALATHALGLGQVAPYAVGTTINRHGFALSLGVRRALWDRLPASDKAMFETAAAAATQLALAEDAGHARMLQRASASEVWPLGPDLARTIARVSDAVVAHAAASDATAQRINASYECFRRLALGERTPAI
jgi:TRAP-type mannitol/chloroaromatic compound transport system substrate-binding protein